MSLFAPRLAAQYPRARVGEFEVRGLDFTATGGWRGRAARVMAFRHDLLRRGAVSLLNGPSSLSAVRGNYFIPVIPISFRDAGPTYPVAQYQDLFFSPAPVSRAWSVKTYYAAASRGNITLDGYVFDWVHVDSFAAYYQDGCNGVGVLKPCPSHPTSRMGDLLRSVLDSVSNAPGADTVWNRFDNDGPDGIPNSGDDDGVIDMVAFIQPVEDGACGTQGIWSHRSSIGHWNNGQPYVTRTPRRDATGRPIPGQFLTIDSYTMQSAVGGNDACTASAIMPVGTVTHETGHAFGLPDLYDTDPASSTQGDGEWSLMASGAYARPYSPSSFDAWSLMQLGWVTVDTLRTGVVVVAPPVQTSNTIYYAGTSTSLYYLLENRGAVGSDTAQMNPAFVHAKVPGLLVWQVDDARIGQGMASNRVNTGARQGVSLIQADGLNQLRTPFGGNRGDGGDPFPGNGANHDFGLATFPAASAPGFSPLEIRIDRIMALPDGSISFRYLHRAASLVISAQPVARIRVNGIATSAYAEILSPGDVLTLSVDSQQVAFDGRSTSRFVSWSDGGAATHTFTSRSGAPDTVSATFAVANRLRVAVAGPGLVASDAQGSLAGGVFVPLGTLLHLTANPATGAEFVGWRGDTVGTGPLELRMAHPYDITAVFTNSVAVDASSAARALLGGTPLDSATVAYLDATGNRNGSYDVGDYLAWLRRTGRTLPAALRRPGVAR